MFIYIILFTLVIYLSYTKFIKGNVSETGLTEEIVGD